MKTLYITRHAKSSWKHLELKDIERPLKRKGKQDAELIAERLRKDHIHPEYFLSSPAVRAHETAKIFSKILDYPKNKIEINSSIYGATNEELHTLILGIDNQFNSVILFGHDPALCNFVTFLTKQRYEKIPTSGVVAIEFQADNWNQIQPHSGKVQFFIYPKMFV
jgi:phosphohistidine phosphatase